MTVHTKMITNKNLEICFRICFLNEKTDKFPQIFLFAFAFVMIMLGTRKPQQQAMLTK